MSGKLERFAAEMLSRARRIEVPKEAVDLYAARCRVTAALIADLESAIAGQPGLPRPEGYDADMALLVEHGGLASDSVRDWLTRELEAMAERAEYHRAQTAILKAIGRHRRKLRRRQRRQRPEVHDEDEALDPDVIPIQGRLRPPPEPVFRSRLDGRRITPLRPGQFDIDAPPLD